MGEGGQGAGLDLEALERVDVVRERVGQDLDSSERRGRGTVIAFGAVLAVRVGFASLRDARTRLRADGVRLRRTLRRGFSPTLTDHTSTRASVVEEER